MVQLCLNDPLHQLRTKPSINDVFQGGLSHPNCNPRSTQWGCSVSCGYWSASWHPSTLCHQYLPQDTCDNHHSRCRQCLLEAKVALVEKHSSRYVEGSRFWGLAAPRDHCLLGSHDPVVNNLILNWEAYTFSSLIFPFHFVFCLAGD